jgi:hypothetical protein
MHLFPQPTRIVLSVACVPVLYRGRSQGGQE